MLPSLISPQQSAFISGRMIQDNIAIAHGVFHFLRGKKRGKREYCAVKLDMTKAYDRVEWKFLEMLLSKMGFSEAWVGWIMTCVKGVRYRPLNNGKKTEEIRPSRGIRQGDPLSPYLFLFVSDVLSSLISKAVQTKSLEAINMKRSCPVVSHLLFADDCKASGQSVNYQKSAIIFSSNMRSGSKRMIGEVLGVDVTDKPDRYLGIPIE